MWRKGEVSVICGCRRLVTIPQQSEQANYEAAAEWSSTNCMLPLASQPARPQQDEKEA